MKLTAGVTFSLNGLKRQQIENGWTSLHLRISKFPRKLSFRSDILHPTHFIMLTLKKRLMDLYRLHPLPQDNPELLRRWLERQVQLGQEQLDIVDKLQPGEDQNRY